MCMVDSSDPDIISDDTVTEEVTLNLNDDSLTPEEKSKVYRTYEDILRDAFNKKLQEVLRKIIHALQDTSFLDQAQEPLKSYIQDPSQEMSFDQTRVLCQQLEALLQLEKKACKFQSENNVLHHAGRALQGVNELYKIDIPRIVQTLNDVVTLREHRHIIKKKRKSIFRKILEIVLPFLRTEDKEYIKIESKALGSLQKGATSFAGEKIAKSLSEDVDNHLASLEIHKAQMKDPNAIKVPIIEREREAPEVAERPSTVKASAANVVARGMARYVNGQLGDYSAVRTVLSYIASPEAIANGADNKDLATYVKEAVDLEGKTIAFQGMMNFVQQIYGVYEVIERMKRGHGDLLEDGGKDIFAQLGFGHMDTPEFKTFLTQLSQALGFGDIDLSDAKDIVHRLYYATDSEKNAAFERFVKSGEQGVGASYLTDVLKKEHERSMGAGRTSSARSSHYHHMIDLNKSMLGALNKKTLQSNLLIEGLKLAGIDEKFLNQEGTGLVAAMSSELRVELINKLPLVIKAHFERPKEIQHEIEDSGHNYSDAICQYFSDLLDKAYPSEEKVPEETQGYLQALGSYVSGWLYGVESEPPILTQPATNQPAATTSVAPSASSSTMAERQAQWDQAADSANTLRAKMPKPPVEKEDPVLLLVRKSWQRRATGILKQVDLLGEQGSVMARVKEVLEQKLREPAVLDNPAARQKLEAQLAALTRENMANRKDLDFETLESLYMAFHDGVQLIQEKGSFKNVDDRADYYMMGLALSHTRSAGTISEIVFKVKNALKTDFDGTKEDKDPGFVARYIAQKSQSVFQEYWAGSPYSQLIYYVDRRNKGKKIYAPNEEQMHGVPASESKGSYLAALQRVLTTQLTQSEHDTPESLNDALVRGCQEAIRAQTFESALNMAEKLYLMKETMSRFKSNHTNVDFNPYKAMGYGSEKQIDKFLERISQSLGFESPEAMAYARATGQMDEVKAKFSKVPSNDHERATDPFVTLKDVIIQENVRMTSKIKDQKLKNSHNYIVLISAFNQLVDQIQTVQKETVAFDLLAPNLDEALGLDEEAKSNWERLKLATLEAMKAPMLGLAKEGLMMQLQATIANTEGLATQMLDGTIERMSDVLEESVLLDSEKNRMMVLRAKTPSQMQSIFKKLESEGKLSGALEDAITYAYTQNNQEVLSLIFKSLSATQTESLISNSISFLQQHPESRQIVLCAFALNAPESNDSQKALKATVLESLKPAGLVLKQVEHILDHYMVSSNHALKSPARTELMDLCFEQIGQARQSSSSLSQVQQGWSQYMSDNDKPLLDEIRNFYVGIEYYQHKAVNDFHKFEAENYWPINNLLVESMPQEIKFETLNAYDQQLDIFEATLNEYKDRQACLKAYEAAWLERHAPEVDFDNLERRDQHIERWQEASSLDKVIQDMEKGLKESRAELADIRQQKQETLLESRPTVADNHEATTSLVDSPSKSSKRPGRS